jgi:DNA-binding NarL/FixJ family response regulator
MPPISAPALQVAASGPSRVLIVDDDARVLRALGELVSAIDGLTVSGLAANAQEAMAAENEGAHDVVVVDVLLPTLDEGLALIRSLSRRRPVLALSLDGFGRDAALAAGAAVFVEKDSSHDSLMAALADLTYVPK